MIRSKRDKKSSTDPNQCNGCGVCMLSCPVWHQHHTKALTACGRNRALIGGASEEEVAPSASACILCGSCEPLCPMGIRTLDATIMLRRKLSQRGILPGTRKASSSSSAKSKSGKQLLLAGKAMNEHPGIAKRCVELIGNGIELSTEDGHEIALAFETGDGDAEKHLMAFGLSLVNCSRLVVADGLLYNLLRSVLPRSVKVEHLGRALLANPIVRSGLRKTDLLVIDPRAYNGERRRAVKLYDAVRRETGCSLNLDLHRVATPTGAWSRQHRDGLESRVNVEDQVDWILEGRNPERIVTEHVDDAQAFRKYTSLPVVHLAEVAGS